MLSTRSFWTVWRVWVTGMSGFSTRSESLRSGTSIGGPLGVQSTKYSAISDCGWLRQIVSSPSTETGPLSSTLTTARLLELTSRSVTVPAANPATFTSEPFVNPKALSNSMK